MQDMSADGNQFPILVGHFDVGIGTFPFEFNFVDGILEGHGISKENWFQEPDFVKPHRNRSFFGIPGVGDGHRGNGGHEPDQQGTCLLYTSPSPRDS